MNTGDVQCHTCFDYFAPTLENFHPRKSAASGLNCHCRKCANATWRKYKKKRRAKERSGITFRRREAKTGTRCWVCRWRTGLNQPVALCKGCGNTEAKA